MFSNATIFRIVELPDPSFPVVKALEENSFIPCGPTQETSSGWVPARDGGELCECINGQLIYKLMTETKTVPSDVVNKATDVRASVIEATTGRKPGKKERREIKDEVLLSLLPHAFPKQVATLAWIDPKNKTLVVDTASQKRADEVATALIKSQEGLILQRIVLNTSPGAVMSEMLTNERTSNTFDVGIDCELKSTDESKTKVKYVKHRLDIPEVIEHIKRGMATASLSLIWLNRMMFTLTSDGIIKNIVLHDNTVEQLEESEDEFDGSIVIITSELSSLIDDLVLECDGEQIATPQ